MDPWCFSLPCDQAKSTCLFHGKCCDLAKHCRPAPAPPPTTATTTAPPTTATTTAMTEFVAITRGSLDMVVSDPETFVESAAAAEAVQKTIADNANVALDAVYVNLITTSLLLTQQAVSQGSVKAGSVKVDYEIRQIEDTAAAANSSAQLAASTLAPISASEWTADIQNTVDSEAAVNFSLNVTNVVEPVPDVIEEPIVVTTTTTSIVPGFEFVGDGSAAYYAGCSDLASCYPNHYQQTYESLNSIDLEETCGEACEVLPCCFGYAYQADKSAGDFFCNLYTVNKTEWNGWTLKKSDYYNISGVVSGTPGRTFKRTSDPGCPPGTVPPTTTSTTETTTTGTDF